MKHWDFILMDLILLQGAFITAYILRHGTVNPYQTALYRDMAIIIELVDFLWILMFDVYNNTLQRKFTKEFVMILNQVFGIALGMTAWLFMTQQGEQYSRSVLCITGIIYIGFNIPARIILKNIVKKKNKKAKNVSLIIVTTAEKAASVIRDVEEHNNRGYVITGIIPLDHTEHLVYEDPIVTPSIHGIPIVSDVEHAADYLQKACQILLQKKSGETICGITRNIGRDGEEQQILTLNELAETQVDMFTTVFVGNSRTRKVGDAMVTPRGYRRDNE